MAVVCDKDDPLQFNSHLTCFVLCVCVPPDNVKYCTVIFFPALFARTREYVVSLLASGRLNAPSGPVPPGELPDVPLGAVHVREKAVQGVEGVL